MRFVFTRRFLKEYRRLPQTLQETADKQLRLLAENPDHPSLDIKKMHDPRGIWRCKVTSGYRFTFQIADDLFIFRRIGAHDIEKKP
jgi:mRNA-degrading endonuclease RelE of RelBE toxin-antitoxin system